jgi:putative nucleotidyltransferase with HDIG domain
MFGYKNAPAGMRWTRRGRAEPFAREGVTMPESATETKARREEVQRLWPELQWIADAGLREKVTRCWERALELSPLTGRDLEEIPFTLLVANCPTTFMEHKRCVVHIARKSAESMQEFMGNALKIDLDTVIAGAILADVGKLLEYEKVDGKARQSERGELLRHPFTGVALAMECGVPDAVRHIIAAHAAEGDLVKRTTEAFIVHHADFMAFLPFKNPGNLKKS